LFAAENCANLRHLSVFGCLRLTDESVTAVAKRCSMLEEVSLRNVTQVTSAAVQAFGASLKGLNASGCRALNARAAAFLGAACPQLERLNLHGVRVDDAAVDKLVRGCPRLTTLHLSSANPFGGSSPLTDQSLVSVARLPALRTLNLQGAR
jgi:hypothetical protein